MIGTNRKKLNVSVDDSKLIYMIGFSHIFLPQK
jgi:hypothetical protein